MPANLAYLPPEAADDSDVPAPPKSRRSWRGKFGDAFRGLKLGIRGHSSFFVHFFFAALVIAAATVLRCGTLEWCILVGCIGMVLAAELFNSALELLCRALTDELRSRIRPALDVAAAAVLVASMTAAVIGSIVFLRSIAALLF
jgi:diacylglycerol kinase